MNVPKLRFKEFNDEYNITKLNKIIDVIDGDRGNNYPKKNDFYENEFCLFLNAGNVTKNGFSFKSNQFITKEKDKKLRNGKLLINDIVLTTRGTVGNVAWFNQKTLYKNIRINSGMVINRIKNSSFLLPEYLYSYMSSPIFKSQVNKMNYGSAQPQLTVSGINNFNIQYPSINEQKKISTIMLLLDKKIELQSKKIEGLKLFKKRLSTTIFNSLRDFEEYKLGKICNITTGKLDANAMIDNGKYRFYTCAKEYSFIDKYAFDTEALLISGNGAYVGYIHYYKGRFNVYQRTYVLDNFSQNIQFIKCYLDENLAKRINSEKKEGNTPYIVLSTLSDMVIKIPSKENQIKISNIINYHNKKIELEENKLLKLQEFKKGLMQNMFV